MLPFPFIAAPATSRPNFGRSPARNRCSLAAIIRTLPPSSEVAFDVIGGEPIVVAFARNGSTALYDRNGHGLPPGRLVELAETGVRNAWPQANVGGIARIPPTDVYALAEGWPGSAVQIGLIGAGAPSVIIDASDGRLLTVMSGSRAAYAWIYYALHTFNFPGLTTRPVLRDILVMIPLIFGFIFSITGVVIGVHRLRKSL